mgnify:FL=1
MTEKKEQYRTVEGKRLFLKGIANTGTIIRGCEYAGISRETARMWMKDPDFAERVSEARMEVGEQLEETALSLVRDPATAVRSQVLLMFLLNGNMPQKYRPAAVMQEDAAKDLMKELRETMKTAKGKDVSEPDSSEATVEEQLQEILQKRVETDGEPEVD